MSSCEKILREKNILTFDDKLVLNKINFSGDLNSASNKTEGSSVKYEFFSFKTKKKLNTEVCNESKMKIKIPLNNKEEGIDIDEILKLQKESNGTIDVFNSESVLFNDLCATYIDPKTGKDTTVSSRRKKFFMNYTVTCETKISNGDLKNGKSSQKCIYNGIDKYGFVNCECGFTENAEIITTFEKTILDDFVKINFEIVKCYNMLNFDNVKDNIGFWITTSCIGISAVVLGVYFAFFKASYLKENLDKILNFDCSFSDINLNLKVNLNSINTNNVPNIPNIPGTVGFPKRKKQETQISSKDNNNNFNSPDITNGGSSKKSLFSKKENSNILSNSRKCSIDKVPEYIQVISSSRPKTKLNKEPSNQINVENNLDDIIDNPSSILRNNNNILGNTNIELELHNNFIKKDKKIKSNNKHIKPSTFFVNNENKANNANSNTNNIFQNQNSANALRFYSNSSKSDSNSSDTNFTTEFSNKDINNMTVEQKLKYDKRSNKEYLCQTIRLDHSILNLFFFKSILDPIYLRVILFVLEITLMFTFNAIIFSDEYINERLKSEETNPLVYVLVNEIGKSFLANVCTTILLLLVGFIKFVTAQKERTLNIELRTKNLKYIKIGYKKFVKSMRIQYFFFILISVFYFIFSLYYCTIFCTIYKQSALGWLIGSLISLIINFCGFQFIAPLLITFLRHIAKKYPSKKWILGLYSLIHFLKMFF